MEQKPVRVAVEESWPMGHRLQDHDGKCRGLHGHTYRLRAEFEGALRTEGSQRGMVADFAQLKAAVRRVRDQFDHAMVLESGDPACEAVGGHARLIELDFPPTAEALASHIFVWLNRMTIEALPCACVRVTLWESETTSAEARL